MPQAGVPRQVGHDPQLDLRIVGAHQLPSGRRDERFADAPALRRADGDVLQVGVVGRKAPGDRNGLRVGRVHPAGSRVHHARQFVGVRRFQLRDAAVVEQDLGQREVGREFLQHVLVGGRLPARGFLLHRQPLLLEQDLLDLFG